MWDEKLVALAQNCAPKKNQNRPDDNFYTYKYSRYLSMKATFKTLLYITVSTLLYISVVVNGMEIFFEDFRMFLEERK